MAKPKPALEPKVLLTAVVEQVIVALKEYQNDPTVIAGTIPKLLSADFEFKTVTDTKGGFSFSFWIIKIGHTVDKQTVQDVVFHYEVDAPKATAVDALSETQKEPNFQDELVKTIRGAAEAIAAVKGSGATSGTTPLPPFKQLTVTLSFGVTNDTSIGATIPIKLTTLNLNAEKSKNTVHQVKLTFADPKKPAGA
jgi:hypothetical protein